MTTYSYAIGDLVKAKVRAKNSIGWSSFSSVNTAGATIQTAPTFMNDPVKAATSTASILDITWSAISIPSYTGGLAITSYNLEWDQGTSSWAELVGQTTPYTSLSYSKTGLTAGTVYKFRLRAKNSIGFGPYSNEVSMTPSAVPGAPTVTTSTDTIHAKISWTLPATNGASITAYKIYVRKSDLTTFYIESTYCDGTDNTIISNRFCLIPMTALGIAPYHLVRDDLIVAKVEA